MKRNSGFVAFLTSTIANPPDYESKYPARYTVFLSLVIVIAQGKNSVVLKTTFGVVRFLTSITKKPFDESEQKTKESSEEVLRNQPSLKIPEREEIFKIPPRSVRLKIVSVW